jgi:hypothetical protein
MKVVAFCLLYAYLALAVSSTSVVDNPGAIGYSASYLTSMELSRDNGNIQSAWVYINGAGTYAGNQYDTPSYTPYLWGIKYFVWSQDWPDSIYQGFEVICWKMTSGTPGNVVWPLDGTPVYNPNTGGNWITQDCTPHPNLITLAPSGFLVGIGFLYAYPANDGFGIDNTGVGPYDWAYAGSAWTAAPYGKQSARALLSDWGYDPWNPVVEPTTIGKIRTLYR